MYFPLGLGVFFSSNMECIGRSKQIPDKAGEGKLSDLNRGSEDQLKGHRITGATERQVFVNKFFLICLEFLFFLGVLVMRALLLGFGNFGKFHRIQRWRHWARLTPSVSPDSTT